MKMALRPEPKNSGFILLHRSVREHWIYQDAQKFQWWLDILMECNHSEQKVSIGFELLECKRGQSLNSLLTWSKMWRVDVSTVRRFLKLLENDGMVVVQNILKTTRITVCNYDTYNNIATPTKLKKNGKSTRNEKNETESGENGYSKTTRLTGEHSAVYNDSRQAKQFENNPEAIPTQFGSNSDAIQTKNELKNDIKNEEINSFSGYSPQQKKDFEKFEKWILEHTPRVAKMKEPFTIKNFLALKEKITGAEISEFLESMHNYEKLLINNRSAYLTILKWIKRDKKNGTNRTVTKQNGRAANANAFLEQARSEFDTITGREKDFGD